MKLFKIINDLLVGAVYLSWGIALAGIPISVILFFVNLSLGAASALVFAAAFLMCIGVTLLLLPRAWAKGPLANSGLRGIVGASALLLATAIMGIIYFSIGDFPKLNLLFI